MDKYRLTTRLHIERVEVGDRKVVDFRVTRVSRHAKDPYGLTAGRPQVHADGQFIGANPEMTVHTPEEMVFSRDDDTDASASSAVRVYRDFDEVIVMGTAEYGDDLLSCSLPGLRVSGLYPLTDLDFLNRFLLTVSEKYFGAGREAVQARYPPPIKPHLETQCRLNQQWDAFLLWLAG
jgi:hypothetical protein